MQLVAYYLYYILCIFQMQYRMSANVLEISMFLFAGFAGSAGAQISANNKPSNVRTHVLRRSHLLSFDQLQAICLSDFFSQLLSLPAFWTEIMVERTQSIGSPKNLHP